MTLFWIAFFTCVIATLAGLPRQAVGSVTFLVGALAIVAGFGVNL